jgi:hypothetical protein
MSTATPAYLEIIDFLAAGATPQAIVDYHPSAELRRRVVELIAREREAGLSLEDRSELDHAMVLEHILRIAQQRARRFLISE